MRSTFTVVLDYCGGARTDALVEKLRLWNPDEVINVFDNGSPENLSTFITHRNAANSGVGGGIRDCLNLAAAAGARYLLLVVNDVQFLRPLKIKHFRDLAELDPDITHICASVSAESAQAQHFPWMRNCGVSFDRVVSHADILVSLLDVGFIADFGGFPESRNGYGYAWELAFHAEAQHRTVLITEQCVVYHDGIPQIPGDPDAIRQDKDREAREVYEARYGKIPWSDFRRKIQRARPAFQSRPYLGPRAKS